MSALSHEHGHYVHLPASVGAAARSRSTAPGTLGGPGHLRLASPGIRQSMETPTWVRPASNRARAFSVTYQPFV